jgi:hypothetical protein
MITPGIGRAANPLMPVRMSQIASNSIPALRVIRIAIVHLLNDGPAAAFAAPRLRRAKEAGPCEKQAATGPQTPATR